MSKTPLQTIINPSTDPGLNVYATNTQNVPVISSANVIITNTTQYVTEIYNLKAAAAGNVGEIEFNDGTGLAADTGLTYDAASDSLHVTGNVFAGNIRTDNLQYANGTTYSFSGSNYSNGNVASFLPTYTGTITGSAFISSGNANAATFNGSGSGLTNLQAANISGTVANANYALYSYLAYGVDGGNVSGTVSSAGHASIADTANSVAGANVSGAVAFATTANAVAGANVSGTVSRAGTVTTNAQPNITSVGTLTSLDVTGNVVTGNITSSGNANVANLVVSATTNLGSISNVVITGGSTGQTLTTDGAGHLTWSTPGSGTTPNLQQVTEAAASTDQAISITNTSQSIGTNSGALTIDGGLGVDKNIYAGGRIAATDALFAGQYASYSSFTVPKFVARDAGATYIQAALINLAETGSADWVAYGDQSAADGSDGWCDFGFTGSNFSDPLYSITKSNDGYLIVQGLEGVGGNLVLATGDLGGETHRDIVFATGGFDINDERMRLNHEDTTLYIGAHGEEGGTNQTNLDVNGDVIFRSNTTVMTVYFEDQNIYMSNGYTLSSTQDVGGQVDFNNRTVGYSADNAGVASLYARDSAGLGDHNAVVSANGINGTVLIRAANAALSNKDWTFDGAGNLTVPGSIIPDANVAYDLGNATHRFKDLYLSGSTINLGGTLIQVDSGSGNISIGNAVFSSSGTIDANSITGTFPLANLSIGGYSANGQVLTTDVNGHLSWTKPAIGGTIGTNGLLGNAVASTNDVGKLVWFESGAPMGDAITYDIPNVATGGFTVGSRIELFVGTMDTMTVGPASGSGVEIQKAKPLDAVFSTANTWVLSNTHMAKLTMFASDRWILSA